MLRNRGPTLYDVLGVTPDVTAPTLRAAYRSEARINHPDNGGDPQRMIALNRAWAVLRDPAGRRAYDRDRLGLVVVDSSAGSTAVDVAVAVSIAPPPGTATGTVLDFGRYQGWSLTQLARHDPDYLLWLERTSIGRRLHGEIQAALADPRSHVARPRG